MSGRLDFSLRVSTARFNWLLNPGIPIPAEVSAVHGIIVIQTIWATTADLVAGHRLTRSELVPDDAALFRRLGELVPLIAGHPRA